MQWPRIFTAMITPFTPEGALAVHEAAKLARWLVRHGSGGLVLAGTTGESPTLSLEERRALFEAVREAVPEVPVWVGTGHNSTAETVRLTMAATEWGADGVMVVTPYYNKPPQEGLYRHFCTVAEHTPLPVMIYNVPGRTSVTMLPETVAAVMRDRPNVRAVKEAAGSLAPVQRLVDLCPPEAKVYTGDDHLFFPTLAVGGYGVVSVASHLVGDEMAALWQAWERGDVDQARHLHRRLTPIFEELFRVSNPIPLKWAMNQLGLPAGPLRLPLSYPADPAVFHPLARWIDSLRVAERVRDL
ncbi:MAG: 4-hydroxy-tetrahydrodipicolinate synthase [Firmicutes bacterium]|nr:4-hydroxy-tetrahydrodipicolinate synthase [Alicyclobacillaceae bacterium]MCL6498284.1 4-hydroxy-tetrahydrodipicolinate synthase [Bacillota bacterium]